MKKFIFSLVIICPVILLAQTAKTKTVFNVGPEAAYPIGPTSKVAKFGAGGSIKAISTLNKDVKWTFTVGYTTLPGKDEIISQSPKVVRENPKLEFIPIKSGFRINLFKNTFFEPEAVIRIGTNYQSKAGFGFAAGFGYNFMINKCPLDLAFRYENTYYQGAPLSFVGGRVGISFPW